ncbi:MAG: ABC transporter ATP-binding protein [Acidobacteriia bacterium]|nr:ABC transporter ATP-binding protein [Terriglobia bacterium]
MKTILETKAVTKVYRAGKVDVLALRGIDLRAHQGEFVAIMGPSGCGKSTLLHILGGLTTPTSGEVWIDGVNVSALSDAARTRVRRDKIGFVFQRFNLLPTMTAQGNLEIARHIHGNGSGAMQLQSSQEVLRVLGLEHKLKSKPLEMSGGEQQRVALARAVINRPSILLADEPTGNLDSENSQLVLKMLQELNTKFTQTIILITHNPEVAAIAHRLVEMRDGRIVDRAQDVSYTAVEESFL